MAKKRVATAPVNRGSLYQLQRGPRGGKVWEVVEETRRGVFRSRRLSRQPRFKPSDVLLDLSGREAREYVADGRPGGRFGRFKEVPFGYDPASGIVDQEQATLYAADARRQLLDDQARAVGDRSTYDRLRVFFVPDNGRRFWRFDLESWQGFLANNGYRDSRPRGDETSGRWVLAYVDDDGSMGAIVMELFEDVL